MHGAVGSHRREYFSETRFRGSPIQFATKIVTHLLWDVTGSFTCIANFVDIPYFWEILAAMRSRRENLYLPALDRTHLYSRMAISLFG